MPEEFQKKFEPTTRTLAVDILPLNENDLETVKYLLDDNFVIKINNTNVSIDHFKKTIYLTGIDITHDLNSVSGTIVSDDTYKIIMNVNVGYKKLSIMSIEITNATVT